MCSFAIYTNSTLIDEPFCEEVQRLGNIAFMLSIEGTRRPTTPAVEKATMPL